MAWLGSFLRNWNSVVELPVRQLQQAASVIAHAVETARKVVKLFSGAASVSALSQVVQQLSKTCQAGGDLPGGIRGDMKDPAAEHQGCHQKHAAEGEHY